MGSRALERVETGIYRRGGGYVAIYQGPDGRPKKRAAKTLAEARRVRRQGQVDTERGDHPVGGETLLPVYVDAWLETYAGRTGKGIIEETRREYRNDLRRFACVYFQKTRLQDIGPMDIKGFTRWVALGLRPNETGEPKRMLSKNTVRLALAPLKLVLASAVEDRLIRYNPAAGLRPPLDLGEREREKRGDYDENGLWDTRALDEDRARRLLAAIARQSEAREDGHPLYAFDELLFAELILQTGLRLSEACGLEWRHFTGAHVEVRQRFREGRMNVPKSKHSRRAVPLSASMIDRLERHRAAATYRASEDPIFANLSGGHRRGSDMLRRIMRPAADSVGLEWVGWHTLRHTCASMLFRRGASPKAVQLWLGHHDPAFTMRTYVHLMPEDLPSPEFFVELGPGRAGLKEAA